MAQRQPPVIPPGGPSPPGTRVVTRNTDIPEHPWNWTTTPEVITGKFAQKPLARPAKNRTVVLGADGQIVPVCYGKNQGGAVIPWAVINGNLLYIMFIVAEGPVESIDQLGFGDSPSLNFGALGLVAGTDYNVYTGTDTQTADPIFAGIDASWIWTFPRLAYVTAKLDITKANMDQIDVKTFRCVIKGRQVVDPRSDATLAEASRAYSDNAAMCELDFVHERLFGLGALTAEINVDSFKEGCDVCDVVTATGPATPTNTLTTMTNLSGGRIENGTFQWAITNIDANGTESILGPSTADVVLALAGLFQYEAIGNIDVSGGTIASHGIYRRKKNPDGTYQTWLQVDTVNDGTTSYNDLKATSELTLSAPDSADVAQFRCAVHVDSTQQETCQQTIDTLRQCFTSLIVFNNGQFQCVVDTVRDATGYGFHPSNVLRDSLQVNRSDPMQVPTQVQVNFTDVRNGFVSKPAFYPDSPPIGTGDARNDRAVQAFDLPWIPTPDQAIRVAIWLYKRLHRTLVFQWQTNQAGGLVLPGSIVTLLEPRYGITSPLNIIVTSCAIGTDRVTWSLTGEVYDSSDYDLTFHPGGTDSTGTTEPPAPPDPPTNLVLSNIVQINGSGVPAVNVGISWTPAAMPYETSTLIRYSLDSFATYTEMGPFTTGPAILYNPILGDQYEFRLYTLRVSNGQLSDAYASGTIIPSFTDASIPEVTQIQIGPSNWLEFYGPIPELAQHRRGGGRSIDIPAPTVVAAAGGSVDDGDHLVCSSRVYAWGESERGATALVTTGGGNNRVNITNLDPSPPSNVLFKKVYITKTGPGADYYHASDDAPAGTSDSLIHPDSSYTSNDLAPAGPLHGLIGFEIYDAFGIASPATDPMPLFKFLPRDNPPQRYATLDLTPIVHEDPADHAPRIDAYIRVLVAEEGGGVANSTGILFTKHPATWGQQGPPQSIPAHISVVDGVNDNLDVPVPASFVYVQDGGLTADFQIGGLTIAGATPTTRQRMVLLNTTGFRLGLKALSGGSSAGNQINPPQSLDFDAGFTQGAVTVEYDTDNSQWVVVAVNGVGFGSTGGSGTGAVWNQDLVEQNASFRIREIGVVGVLGQQVGGIGIVNGNNDDCLVDDPSGGFAAGVITLYAGVGLSGTAHIRSILPHGNLPGVKLALVNQTGFDVILDHAWGGASPNAAFYCPGAANLTIPGTTGGYCCVIIENSTPGFGAVNAVGGWIVTGKNF